MQTTPRELRRRIEDVIDDLTEQYDAPFCEVVHREFELAETALPDDDREAMLDQFKHMGITIPDDSVKLTVEHRELHDSLRRLVIGLGTNDAAQILAVGLAAGRRVGMADAAATMQGFNWDEGSGADAD